MVNTKKLVDSDHAEFYKETREATFYSPLLFFRGKKVLPSLG